MRPNLVVPVLLAACLVSAIAFAASDKKTATFQSLQASGVTGEVVLDPMPSGETRLHASIRGLQPNTEYISRLYEGDQTCSSISSDLIVRFVANPAGVATWNKKVVQDIDDIGSISVLREFDNQLQACASVTP